MSDKENQEWKFFRFGLIVTGRGEEDFLPNLFRSLVAGGHCSFRVIRRIGQRSPITSKKRKLRMVGSGKLIPDKDAEEIGLSARRFLAKGGDYVMLIDDLEFDRQSQHQLLFARYREALDRMLGGDKLRASVHFLVNMLESYYFADHSAINDVLGTDLPDHDGDVETIRYPKGELNQIYSEFDEIEHGKQIIAKLNVPHVLSRPETCASLRTLFSWCLKAMGEVPTDDYQLQNGRYSDVTRQQIDDLPDVES